MRSERATIVELLARWNGHELDPDAVWLKTAPELAAESLEEALANHRAATVVRQASEEIERAAAAEVERFLGRNWYKSGPNVFVVSQSASWKILDSDKAWRFVEEINHQEGFTLARQLLDLATRKTAWEATAERRNLPTEATVNTFLFRHYGPVGLKAMPVAEAPAYVQRAPDGVIEKLQRTKGGADNEQ